MTDRAHLIPPMRRRRVFTIATLLAVVAAGILALSAFASTRPTLGLATHVPVKTKSDTVVTNVHGVTVYTLSGETTRHLECTKANSCFLFWFPVKVSSARSKLTAAHGIKGKLGTLHRNGFFQVTLAGRPLYTFVGDANKSRRATGEGIVSFGGTWHVIAVRTASTHTTTTTSTSTTSSYVIPGY
jgi:predicted lipoprotein with Yx(FWY)xxD motif